MKKRIASLGLIALGLLTLSSCGQNDDTLLFLNWGEYVDDTLIEKFEEKYNCTVQMDLADTNEIFYAKTKSGTTVYDVICPSDYMVERMYANDLLEKLDYSKLPHLKREDYKLTTKKIYKDMNTNLAKKIDGYVDGTIDNYAVPYLAGTWCIMYNTKKPGLEDAVINNKENQWASLFNRDTLPQGTTVGMYDSHQHDYYAVSKYLGLDPYEEQPKSELDKISKVISSMNYDMWGTDNLKKKIVEDVLDLAFMWTGDFIYYYYLEAAKRGCDAYANGDITEEECATFIDALTSGDKKYEVNGKTYEIGYDAFIPDDTISFCDNLVINKEASNKDLAYKFIDFMITQESEDEEDPTNYPAYLNTYYVGYDAPYNKVYDDVSSLNDPEVFTEDVFESFDPKASLDDRYDSDLFWAFCDYTVGICFSKYYENDQDLIDNNLEPKGNILAFFDRKYVNTINTTFNNARV